MRLLLDTHVFLWARASDPRLSRKARSALLNDENELLLSVVSAWEIILKQQAGRLELEQPPAEYLESRVAESGATWLPLEFRHLRQLGRLPLHHRDPFDRLLVAQALAEGLTLVTSDVNIRRYKVPCLW